MRELTEAIPLQQRRGIETTDLIDELFLVHSPIEQVAQACCQLRQATLWERDVYQRELEIQGHSVIIFQLRGHSWTVIRELSFSPYRVSLGDEDIQSLSRLLQTKAICYQISDSSCSIGYHFYNCGELVEQMRFTRDDDKEIDEDEDEDEDIEEPGTCQFQSQLRQIQAEEIDNVYSFTHNFLQEQDAYVPPFFAKIHFSRGQRTTLKLKGIERDDFERMDYMVLS